MSARRAADTVDGRPSVAAMAVRPPDPSYWSVHDEITATPSTGDPAYDRLIASQRRRRPATATPPARRGLPQALNRRMRSPAGRDTGPGAASRRLVPRPIAPPATEARRPGAPA
ncbi:MAG TPA: hypothetical protein VK866_14930, partial [Acidimicrobiales bacterium]|nr:hypothetical protein [Acidimicrobiales bacterium]